MDPLGGILMVFSTVAAYNVIPSKARDRPARGYRVMFVYILASKTRRLYVGVTGDLVRRVWEHKTGLVAGFTRRYGIDRLVYFEIIKEALTGIQREKQIKSYARVKKLALIASMNPGWADLAEPWYANVARADPSLRSG